MIEEVMIGGEFIKVKTCKKCGEVKLLRDFYKNSRCADGYENICKRCRQLQMKEYYKKKQSQKKSTITKRNKQLTKKCNKCGEVKPISEFYKNNRYADGYENVCKTCRNTQKKIKIGEKDNYPLEKKCRKCGEVKPVGEFYKSKYSADGYENICKECRNKQQRERRKTYKKCLWCGRKLAPSAFYSSKDIYCKKCMLERMDKKEWVKDTAYVLRKEGKDYVPPSKETLKKLPTKFCRKCGKEYPLAYFSKNKARPDGYDDYCKICRKRINALSYRRNMSKRISNRRKNQKYNYIWRLYHSDYIRIKNRDYKEKHKKSDYYYPLDYP